MAEDTVLPSDQALKEISESPSVEPAITQLRSSVLALTDPKNDWQFSDLDAAAVERLVDAYREQQEEIKRLEGGWRGAWELNKANELIIAAANNALPGGYFADRALPERVSHLSNAWRMAINSNQVFEKRFGDVHAERVRQDEKWGEQNHTIWIWLAILGEEVGEANQAALEFMFGNKSLSEYRKELVEVAAVAVAAIECYDRTYTHTD